MRRVRHHPVACWALLPWVVFWAGCDQAPGGPPGDDPARGWAVWSVFLGCQPLPAGAPVTVAGACPPGAAPACRGRVHWCRSEDGARHGPWLRLHTSGGPDLLVHYRHGAGHGSWRQWYPGGGQMRSGGFLRGRKHGVWKGWYPDGRQAYHHVYDSGEPTGHWTHWDRAGNPADAGVHRP